MVSASGLFAQTIRPCPKDENFTDKVLKGRPARVAKRPKQGKGIFARFSSPKKTQHPLYTSFAEACATYREGVVASRAEQLDPVCNALIARVNGLTVEGEPLKVPGLPTEAEMDALRETERALSKPFEEEVMTAQWKENGKQKEKEVKLGDTMETFRAKSELRCAELEGLFMELSQVDAEIASVANDLLSVGAHGVGYGDSESDEELAAIKFNIHKISQQTLSEIKQARKEDQAAVAEANRKFQEFTKSLV